MAQLQNGSVCNENRGLLLAPTSREQRALKVNPKNQKQYQKKFPYKKIMNMLQQIHNYIVSLFIMGEPLEKRVDYLHRLNQWSKIREELNEHLR